MLEADVVLLGARMRGQAIAERLEYLRNTRVEGQLSAEVPKDGVGESGETTVPNVGEDVVQVEAVG